MTNYLRNKKGMYSVTPLLGIVFFMITVTTAAFVYNENVQQVEFAKSSFGHDILFVAQAIESDIFDVLLQNYLQQALDNLDPGTALIRTELVNAIRNTITYRAADVYASAYLDASNIECECTSDITAGTYVLFDSYGGGKIIDIDRMTEIKPIVSRYGVKCESQEPVSAISLQFSSRPYYLDAWNICWRLPAAC
jgi:hypothetical protein